MGWRLQHDCVSGVWNPGDKLAPNSQASSISDLDTRVLEAILRLLLILFNLLLNCAMVTLKLSINPTFKPILKHSSDHSMVDCSGFNVVLVFWTKRMSLILRADSRNELFVVWGECSLAWLVLSLVTGKLAIQDCKVSFLWLCIDYSDTVSQLSHHITSRSQPARCHRLNINLWNSV